MVDEETFRSFKVTTIFDQFNTCYYCYTAEKPLPILGQFTTRIERKGKSVRAGFILIKGNAECLMSCNTAQLLGVISVDVNRINSPNIQRSNERNKSDNESQNFQCSLENLYKRFPKLFSGELGCMKDIEVKLDIDPSVRPTRQPQRPIAFHLRDAVEKELLKQIDQGILERVDARSGPTPWVANLVIVPKDRAVRNSKSVSSRPIKNAPADLTLGVRLTCDSRAQNKAIRRTRYPSKTVEDLVYLVNGATIFSKLDILKAFHQMMLAEESRYLTTITTHIGLLRYDFIWVSQ